MYPTQQLEHLDDNSSPCPKHRLTDWEVTSQGDLVRINELVYQGKTSNGVSQEQPLPVLLKHQQGMPGNTVRAGLKTVLHFKHNWLLAYDAGEWGGGLWLTNEDGTQTKRILSDNVTEMIPIDDVVLVLSGLAHGTIDFGNAFIFSIPDGMDISLQHAGHLDGRPRGYAKEPNGSALFVTTYALCRVTKSGEVQMLMGFPRWSQHEFTTSIVIARDGAIFIGMRMFVLRLLPNSGRYTQEWLLPKQCQ